MMTQTTTIIMAMTKPARHDKCDGRDYDAKSDKIYDENDGDGNNGESGGGGVDGCSNGLR